jgi:hypothetical protein
MGACEEAAACSTQAPYWRGTWAAYSLQDPSAMLEGRWAHPYTPVTLGLPAWGLDTSQRTRGAWATLGVTHARASLGDT